ncbi:MAG: MraY family glycosyltransferase [Patescibacteria group bacterium]|jgi:UDP-GlcNAc:undecaprenyl-phosphate GlcNAc-1-phosphate transferase|nr:MraY family glycosyltransferase [Patescibacteria group bacterium]
MSYFLAFISSFGLAVISTWLIRKLALKLKIVDRASTAPERKIHQGAKPLLGGLAVFLSMAVVAGFFVFKTDLILNQSIATKNLIGVLIASILIMIGGILDDKFNLKPWQQILWPVLATIIVIASGVGIKYITNPLGGLIYFDSWKIELFRFNGLPYYFTVWSDIFTFFWLMVMMYTTKFLDGLDGLVSGISGIGGLAIAGLCLATAWYQPEVAILALIFSGACAGFLVLNWHPAKIFLGESGSLWCGFMLGILAIIAGGKIATAVLVLGIPILDLAWVILRRLISEHKAPWLGDNKHLHFRLLDMGLTQPQVVLFLYLISLIFGGISLFLHSFGKLIALGMMLLVMLILAIILIRKNHWKNIET